MPLTRHKLTLDSARRMLRHGAYRKVSHLLEGMRPGDAAAFFESITIAERRRLAGLLGQEPLARLLGALPAEVAVETFAEMQDPDIVALIGQIPREDAAAVLRFLDADRREAILGQMDTRTSNAVEELLAYPQGSVGSIMKPQAFALDEGLSVEEATLSLQRAADGGPVFYIYVTDKRGYLVGVVSYRMLLLARRETVLRDIMTTSVTAVRADEPQEEAAELVTRHDLVAVPVVDADHRLLGVVTVDDIVDIMQAKATEDLYRMAGLGTDDRVFCPPTRSIKKRLPWLFVNLLTAFMAAAVVGLFKSTIEAFAVIAVYQSIVAGMGGNAATQTLTVVIRGLTIGELTVHDAFRAILKEGSVNLAIGLVLGTAMAFTAFVWNGNATLGFVLGAAMVCNMLVAGVMGALIPLVLRMVRIDPALASGVIVTTFTDCCGFFAYFGIATLLLARLKG